MKWKEQSATASTIISPGVYDISKKAYHSDPCIEPSLSRGFAVELIKRTPAHARLKHPRFSIVAEEHSEQFDLGKAVESMFFDPKYKGIDVIQANDWRTTAAKEARDRSRSVGRIPMLARQCDEAKACVVELRKRADEMNILKEGKSEMSYFWQEENGVWCRSRPDFTESDGWLSDLKTTGIADPEGWEKSSYEHGYDIQAYMGLRGYFKTTGQHAKGFRFVIGETERPHAIYIAEYPIEMLDQAREKFEITTQVFKRCMETNIWPAYPREPYLLKPTYRSNQLLDKAYNLYNTVMGEWKNG